VNLEKGAVFSSKIEIGDNSGIGVDCRIAEQVSIGNRVMMGPECIIFTRNHKFNRHKKAYSGYTKVEKVVIEDKVWIGARCIILPGVTIGEGATIGAGSVVSKDVPPYTVVAGNPASVVKNLL